MGVFAADPLRAGTLLWVFDPVIDQEISEDELAALPEAVRSIALTRSFVSEDGRVVLARDNGVFLNHSECPNMAEGDLGSVAARDIARGEELTEDYRLLPPGACRAFLDNPRPRNKLSPEARWPALAMVFQAAQALLRTLPSSAELRD